MKTIVSLRDEDLIVNSKAAIQQRIDQERVQLLQKGFSTLELLQLTEQDLKNQVRQTGQAIANKQTTVKTQLFQLRCLLSHIANFIQENEVETESQRQSNKVFAPIAVDEAS